MHETMRVSDAFRYDGYSATIRSADTRMQEASERVTSGKRIEQPSDDASGTRQLLSIGSVRSSIAGYTKNLTTAKGVLASTDSTYGDLNDLVQSARTLAIQGATSTMDDAERANIADQIQSLQDRLVSLGNSQAPDGRYMFGGQVTDAKPFTVNTDGTLAYSGNTTVPTVETGPGESTKVGETGTSISDLYSSLATLQSNLRSGNISAVSSSDLAALEKSSDTLTAAQGDVGRRLDAIASSQTVLSRQDTDLSSRASDIGDVDYATAIVDYTAAQSTYQAALTVASKGFSMSLMDYMK